MPTYVYTIKNNPLMGYFFMLLHVNLHAFTCQFECHFACHSGLTCKKLGLYTINAEKRSKIKKNERHPTKHKIIDSLT